MTETERAEAAGDELVIALSPRQLVIVAAIVIVVFILLRARRSTD